MGLLSEELDHAIGATSPALQAQPLPHLLASIAKQQAAVDTSFSAAAVPIQKASSLSTASPASKRSSLVSNGDTMSWSSSLRASSNASTGDCIPRRPAESRQDTLPTIQQEQDSLSCKARTASCDGLL